MATNFREQFISLLRQCVVTAGGALAPVASNYEQQTIDLLTQLSGLLGGSSANFIVGEFREFGLLSLPAKWLNANGAAISRSTYAALFVALTSVQTATLNSTAVVTGLATAALSVGLNVAGTGIPANTTILTIDSGSQITLSAAATVTGSQSLTFHAWGLGDGSTTFNLPDRRGRSAVGSGTGGSLTARALGQSGGAETHTLSTPEMPSHTHGSYYQTTSTAGANANQVSGSGLSVPTTSTGGGAAHNNMQPFAVVTIGIYAGV